MSRITDDQNEYKRIIIQVHKDVTTDEIHKALYDGNVGYCAKDSDWLYVVKETHENSDGTKRMTTKQRDKLWDLCGGYNVPFREDDYRVQNCNNVFGTPVGWAEGWIGGYETVEHPTTKQPVPKTIYIAVEPNGDSHS